LKNQELYVLLLIAEFYNLLKRILTNFDTDLNANMFLGELEIDFVGRTK
jgi:hypothetical protein